MYNFNKKIDNYEINSKSGVTYKDEYVCATPIVISAILTDINTDDVSIEIAWFHKVSGETKTIVVDKKILMNKALLKQLYDKSFDISDENIAKLCKYFSYVFAKHQDDADITKKLVTEKLGWHLVNGNLEFIPYSAEIACNPDDSLAGIKSSIYTSGLDNDWFRGINKLQTGDCVPAKIAISASFASSLMRFFSVDPFIVNFYGKTGIGKTLLLNIAASLWGSSDLIQNSNASTTGLEAKLKFLNSLPFLLDEIKFSDSSDKKLENLAYIFSGGKGKARGNTFGGLLAPSEGWRNIMISSGEQPYIENGAANGVVNRVLDVNCGELPLFAKPRETYEFFRSNFGFIQNFFKKHSGNAIEKLIKDYESEFKGTIKTLIEKGISEKQASLGAVLLISNLIFCEQVLDDSSIALKMEEIIPFLRTEKSIDTLKDTLQSLYEHIEINSSNFVSETITNPKIFYGVFDDDSVYVLPKVVTDFLELKKVNKNQFNSYLKKFNLIEISADGKSTVSKTFHGRTTARYYCFKLAEVIAFLED